MAVGHADLFTVTSASDIEELERVLNEETEGSPGSITIDIPDGATTFFNARDFRRLLQAARASETELLVRTDDPLRRELARIIGIAVAPGSPLFPTRDSSRVASSTEPTGPNPIEPVQSVAAPVNTGTDRAHRSAGEPANSNDQDTTRAAFQPWHKPIDAAVEDADDPDESDASFSFVITPPVPRRANLMTDTAASAVAAATDVPRLHERTAVARRRNIRLESGHRTRRRLLGIAVIALTLVALTAVAFGLVLPSATIAVTPQVSEIEASLTYGLDTPGAVWDMLLPPVPLSTTLTFSASGPTSGERFEPEATATGSVVLTNATTVDVTVAVGTILGSENGIDVVTVEEIVVPAADPYGSLTLGSISSEVRAGIPGPEGNLAAGAIYGQLDNGIFYTNRDPLSGGTSRRIAVVTQADLDALERQARANLQGQASVALVSTLQPNQQLVEGSEQWSSVEATFDRHAGDDATTVRIDATLTVSGQAFDSSAWHDGALREVETRLAGKVLQGTELIDGSIELSEPEPIARSGGTAFTVRSTARVRSEIDGAELQRLQSEVANVELDKAVARIQQVEGVDEVRIEQDNDWLTGGLPRLTSRITIEVVDAEGVSP